MNQCLYIMSHDLKWLKVLQILNFLQLWIPWVRKGTLKMFISTDTPITRLEPKLTQSKTSLANVSWHLFMPIRYIIEIYIDEYFRSEWFTLVCTASKIVQRLNFWRKVLTGICIKVWTEISWFWKGHLYQLSLTAGVYICQVVAFCPLFKEF